MPTTLLEFKPVTYNLHNPIDTFTNILIFEILLIFIHFIYTKITKGRNYIRKVVAKYNFFSQVSSSELWVLIIASAILWTYTILKNGLYTEESLNITNEMPPLLYIINLLISGYYTIIFIFFMPQFNLIKYPYNILKKTIIALTIIFFIVGIATNMRTSSIMVIANAFFLFIIYTLYYPIDYKKYFRPQILLIFIIIIYFFTGPFMVISKAMLENRGDRAGKSGIEMIEMTFNSIQNNNNQPDKEYISKESGVLWDEKYLDNDILNRFCSIKILDETLFHAKRIGYANPTMQEELKMKIIDSLPGFIKQYFNINIPKDIRYSSLSDILYALSINTPTATGGIKIGTLQGLGLAIFGYWYLLILIPIFIIIFYFLDAMVAFDYKTKRIYFSLCFFINVVTICYFFSDGHHYLYEFRFIMRTFFEKILFFIITINLIKKIPFIKH